MKKSHGFTLVELMIAITIGLILMAIISQIFLGTKQTFRTQDDLSRVQEDGRYALELMSRSLRLAGYRDNYNVAYNDSTGGFPAASLHLSGAEGGSSASDSISIRYFGSGLSGAADKTIRDCTGTSVDQVTRQTDAFSVSGGFLICNATNLIKNVADMQILYGIDTDTDKVPNKYLKADDPSMVWDNVVAVRLCIELTSANKTATTSAQNYTKCGATAAISATDNLFHRTFSTTVALRNKLN